VKTYLFIMLAAVLIVSGCNKAGESQQTAEVNSDGLSVSQADTLLAQPVNEVASGEGAAVANIVVNKESEPLVEDLAMPAAQAPETPDPVSIQTALKNANFYNGDIDGKVGPKTKAAIKEFQAKNGLSSDGKVGPKTWSLLKTYL